MSVNIELEMLLFATIVLFILELLYFKLADHFNIIDKPNHRSSHTTITIRGGGIIFSLAMLLLSPIFFGLKYPFFLIGLFLVSAVSFIDDIKPVSSRIRLLIHIVAAFLLMWQFDLLHAPVYVILFALFFIIATINAVNFMDGINGITGIYALTTLCTFYYLNLKTSFTDGHYLSAAIIGVVVFNFFNFRKRAKCFAGDVGSVGIAFIILFFLSQLVLKTQNLNYLFFLLVYVLDTCTTIMFRLLRKEKITEAHRSHFYQYLVNEARLPHLIVAVIYGFTQLLTNIVIIKLPVYQVAYLALLLIVCLISFVLVRFSIEGKKHLLAK